MRGRLGAGDVVLVKASNGVELWHVVDDLVTMLGGEDAGTAVTGAVDGDPQP